ncbi:hypothetical protein GCM10018965_029160 [Nonomuraea roseola]
MGRPLLLGAQTVSARRHDMKAARMGLDEVPDLVDIYLHRPQDLPATVRDY